MSKQPPKIYTTSYDEMVYRRYSDYDDESSDVYAYGIGAGFMLHLTGNRAVLENLSYPFGGSAVEVLAYLETTLETVWVFDTLEELRDKLHELAAVGYRVPASAFAAIEEDLQDK